MTDDEDERTEAVREWPDLIARITKVVRKTRCGRLKTEILKLNDSLHALHSIACSNPSQLVMIDTDDERLLAVLAWPALASDIAEVVARTEATLHASEIIQLDDAFYELNERIKTIPSDGIALHRTPATRAPKQPSSEESETSDLPVSPSIRHLIPAETSSESVEECTDTESDFTPSGNIANRPKVPGVVHNIKRSHRDHGFQHPEISAVYGGRLFENLNVDFEKSAKQPKIISAPEGSTGLKKEYSSSLVQGPPAMSLEDTLQVDMRSQFGIQHDRKPSVYNHGSRILILWGQEDPQRGLIAPDQPAFFQFPHLHLTAISPFVRNLLLEKESGRLDDVDFLDKIVYDPDYTMKRKSHITNVTIYLLTAYWARDTRDSPIRITDMQH